MQNNESGNDAKPWGKLTSFNVAYDNVNMLKESYTIGRRGECDVVISDIRLSGVHCRIYRDEDGNYYIEDLSSNGTFIEDEKIGKGNKRKITSGDKIYLLHKSKVPMNEIIGYIFSAVQLTESISKKKREEEEKALEEERKKTEKQSKFQEELGEEMQCCICIDYIYQCASVIPCLHNFCKRG